MEENQEMRHKCKFCDKSFLCGRALGGHMRSHLNTNPAARSIEQLNKKKLPSFINDDDKEAQSAAQNGYSLREKPKKTNKFVDSIEESCFFDHDDDDDHSSNKVCKECGKKFPTWKYLFAHMKCHSDKVSMNVEAEGYDDSLNSGDHQKKLVWDDGIQSDNETAAPIRKQRSRNTKKNKGEAISTNSSMQIITKASSSCVSEIEQEEVALSLILLSRDVTVHFCGGGESNSRISVSSLSDSKSECKNLNCNDSEFVMSSKVVKTARVVSLDPPDCLKSKLKQSEHKDTSISRIGIEKMSAEEVEGSGLLGDHLLIEKAKTKDGNDIQGCELEIKKQKAKRRRKRNAMDDHEKCVDSPFYFVGSEKKHKFECTCCNKIFHSYQALGGHRASHKKMKTGCFSSNIDSTENSTETEISPMQSTDTKFIIHQNSNTEKIKNSDYVGSKKHYDKVHECPICFKIFPSGQALGGHKRSHMLAEAKSNNNNNKESETTTDFSKIENNKMKKIPDIKDFLDLNLPAPEQDEVAGSSDRVYCNPWWMGVGSNRKQEQLVGLL